MEGRRARGPGEPAREVAVERDRRRGEGGGSGFFLLCRLVYHLLREEPCEVDSPLPELETALVDPRDEIGVGYSGRAGDADLEDRARREREVDGVELMFLSFFSFLSVNSTFRGVVWPFSQLFLSRFVCRRYVTIITNVLATN